MARTDAAGSHFSASLARTQRLTHLPVLVLEAHSSCNCRCVMCDIWKRGESRGLEPSDLEPHLAAFRRLGVRWIVLSGGEPLLNRRFPQLCRMLRGEGVQLTLLTTGLLIGKYAREIAESFDDAIVSLDGPEEIHDRIRRVPGAFRLIDSGVQAIRKIEGGFAVTARTTVQKLNFRYLRGTVDAAKTLALNGISFLAVDMTSSAFHRPLAWPIDRQNEVALTRGEADELEAEIDRLLRERGGDMRSGFVRESPEKLRHIVRHFRAHLGLEEPEAPTCNAPWTSAVLDQDGAVRPCFFHAPIGTIRGQRFEEAINSERALEFRSTLDIRRNPICRQCVCSLNYKHSAG